MKVNRLLDVRIVCDEPSQISWRDNRVGNMLYARNVSNMARYHARKTRWLHDWIPPESRPRRRPDTPTRVGNWIMLLAGLYMAAQLIRWALEV